jgi:hypothetical protein
LQALNIVAVRRLETALDRASDEAKKLTGLTKWLTWLTGALILLTIALVVVGVLQLFHGR